MSADANAAAARRVTEEAFNEGRLEVIDELCSPDIVTHDPAEPEDLRGTEVLKERVMRYRTAMSDLRITFEDIFATEDRVAARWTAQGTNDGELAGMPATGKKMAITGNSIDRFDSDGKIVETWDNWDNAGFMAQLGLTPEMAGQAS
jgi:steroid delta-isomerase-like uncharacterized protein